VDALAAALRLGDDERLYVRALLAHSGERQAFVRESVPAALERIVKSLNQPAYVTGRRWDVLAWNSAAAETFTDFGRIPEEQRNILLFMFTDPAARRLFGSGWTKEAKRMLAQFRSTHDVWAGDPAFLRLLEALKHASTEFLAWWEAHEIRGVSAGQKVLNHPGRGSLRFEYAAFQSNDDPSLKLVICRQL
jgi:hypothetical protein